MMMSVCDVVEDFCNPHRIQYRPLLRLQDDYALCIGCGHADQYILLYLGCKMMPYVVVVAMQTSTDFYT